MSADTKIAELLTELHQLIKQTQEERSRIEHNLLNIRKTHERMQTENKRPPNAEPKCRVRHVSGVQRHRKRHAGDTQQKRHAGSVQEPLGTAKAPLLIVLCISPPPLCGATLASSDYVAKQGDKVAARVKAVDGDEQWILAEVVSYNHSTNKYEVDDIDEEGKERHTLSRRRIIPLPQWKANPETDPEALFQKDQLVLALYPQTTCFYRALIHTPPHRVRPSALRSLLYENVTSFPQFYSPPLNVAQRYVVACKENKKK
ncbi:LOW QUALITY PROTEIN: SAGA-associated factor 29 [Sander vitreus]